MRIHLILIIVVIFIQILFSPAIAGMTTTADSVESNTHDLKITVINQEGYPIIKFHKDESKIESYIDPMSWGLAWDSNIYLREGEDLFYPNVEMTKNTIIYYPKQWLYSKIFDRKYFDPNKPQTLIDYDTILGSDVSKVWVLVENIDTHENKGDFLTVGSSDITFHDLAPGKYRITAGTVIQVDKPDEEDTGVTMKSLYGPETLPQLPIPTLYGNDERGQYSVFEYSNYVIKNAIPDDYTDHTEGPHIFYNIKKRYTYYIQNSALTNIDLNEEIDESTIVLITSPEKIVEIYGTEPGTVIDTITLPKDTNNFAVMGAIETGITYTYKGLFDMTEDQAGTLGLGTTILINNHIGDYGWGDVLCDVTVQAITATIAFPETIMFNFITNSAGNLACDQIIEFFDDVADSAVKDSLSKPTADDIYIVKEKQGDIVKFSFYNKGTPLSNVKLTQKEFYNNEQKVLASYESNLFDYFFSGNTIVFDVPERFSDLVDAPLELNFQIPNQFTKNNEYINYRLDESYYTIIGVVYSGFVPGILNIDEEQSKTIIPQYDWTRSDLQSLSGQSNIEYKQSMPSHQIIGDPYSYPGSPKVSISPVYTEKGVQGAQVKFVNGEKEFLTTSMENGLFEITHIPYSEFTRSSKIIVMRDGYNPSTVNADTFSPVLINLEIKAPSKIKGKVIDQNGNPVGDATIQAKIVGIYGNKKDPIIVQTSYNGEFELPFDLYEIIASKVGYNSQTVDIQDKLKVPSPDIIQIEIQIEKVGIFLNSENGHYYEIVSSPGIKWYSAKKEAEKKSLNGTQCPGHLATITSQGENDFIVTTFGITALNSKWLGAFQNDANSNTINDGWQWITDERWSYSNWNINEPNNLDYGSIGFEDALSFWNNGAWNDAPSDYDQYSNGGYIVEYEC